MVPMAQASFCLYTARVRWAWALRDGPLWSSAGSHSSSGLVAGPAQCAGGRRVQGVPSYGLGDSGADPCPTAQ
eukprot:7092374-Alexandrium_andersonii.AAC.1